MATVGAATPDDQTVIVVDTTEYLENVGAETVVLWDLVKRIAEQDQQGSEVVSNG